MAFLSFASFGIGSAPSAAAAWIVSVILFAIVGAIAGTNLEKLDVEDKKYIIFLLA